MSIYQKQIESERLNNDVEQWLAQNTIKTLPMGFTHFPDGIVPSKPVRVKESESERLEKKRKIKEQNELLRERREKERAEKRAQAYQRKLELARIYRAKKREEKAKKEAEAITKFGRIVEKHCKPKISKLKLVQFSTWSRYKALIEIGLMRKRDAENRNESTYMGFCHKHDETEYKITNYGGRCVLCLSAAKEARRVKEAHPEAARRKQLHDLKMGALQKGEASFDGPCKIHGQTRFQLFPATETARCIECKEKKKAERVSVYKDPRIKANREACDLAIKQGQKAFTALCTRHGVTDHKVNLQTRYMFCVQCRRETQRNALQVKRQERLKNPDVLVEKKRKELNLAKRKEAIAKGVREFTGQCLKHGESQFVIFRDGKKLHTHKCRKCKSEVNAKTIEKNFEANLKHPRTQALIQHIANSSCGEASRIAALLGLGRSTVNHFTSGRAVISEEYFNKIFCEKGEIA